MSLSLWSPAAPAIRCPAPSLTALPWRKQCRRATLDLVPCGGVLPEPAFSNTPFRVMGRVTQGTFFFGPPGARFSSSGFGFNPHALLPSSGEVRGTSEFMDNYDPWGSNVSVHERLNMLR